MNKLFVYGTLAPGQSNHDVLADLSGEWEAATVNGTLVEEGWGAGHGCPGLIPSSEAPEIQGYLFISNDLNHNWDRLDEFEGEDYRREQIKVRLTSGVELESYVYAIRSTDKL